MPKQEIINPLEQAALASNNIPESVYDTLVETINKNLHLLHRYVKFEKKIIRC